MIKYNKLNVLYMDDIYAYTDLNRENINNYLLDNNMDLTPDNIEDCASMFIDDEFNYLMELVNNYDKKADYDYILIDATFGLWSGPRQASKTCKTLKDALMTGSYDINIIYFTDSRSTLKKASSHHDGENYYKYYAIRNGKKFAIKINELLNI